MTWSMAFLPIPELAHGHMVTLWGWGKSIADSWDDPRTKRLLEQAQPTGVQLHGSWDHLIRVGPAITQMAQADGYAVWWGIAGDGDSREANAGHNAAERWPRVMEAAHACGVNAVILNCEGHGRADPGYGWTAHDAAQIQAALEGMREKGPGVFIGHTAWGWPIWSSEHRYGGFPGYPWAEFLGEGRADFQHPQVYYGASFGAVKARYDAYLWSWGEAVRTGLCRPDIPTHIYLACATDIGHHPTDASGNIWIAGHHHSISWWTVPDYDEPGRIALVASCKLWNKGYRWDDDELEPHPVRRFQKDEGLTVDGVAGARQTLPALGM